jgi:predicted PurR-regulated permease PerM
MQTDRKLMIYLIAVPSVVITLAGIKAAASIIVPLLLAFILATIAGSSVLYLQGRGLPRWLSMLIVLLAVILLVIGLGLFVSSAAMEFSDRIPDYEAQFLEIMNQLLITLNEHGIALEKSELLIALADHGLAMSLWVGLFFLAINIVFGVMIEPRVTGKGLGLSSVVVLLSLIFWGWILGPIGMLLSIPMTIMVKVACDLSPRTRWISILLGDGQEQQA